MRRSIRAALALSCTLAPPMKAARADENPGAIPPPKMSRSSARAEVLSGSVDRSKIPGGGAAPKLSLPSPSRFTLSSGATLLVVERHELPMASVSIVWPSGESDVPPAQAGLASLTASLLDEGTKRHGALALAEAFDGIGAQLATGATWDLTAVSLTTLTKRLDEALALLAEVVAEPAFDDKEVARVKGETLTAILQRKDVAQVVASDVFGRALYGARRFGLPASGTKETVEPLGRAQIVDWYASRLVPQRATIIVAGDVTPSQARAALEKALASWRAEPRMQVLGAIAEPPLPAPRKLLVDKPGAPQSELRLGLPGVPRGSPDYFPLVVMNEVLGGGEFSNRLNLNLREAHAYTYGAHSAFAFRKEGGPFVAAAATKTNVTAPSVMETFSELLRIRAAPVEPNELRLAKDGLERAMARRFATLADVTGELAAQVIYGLPADYFATFAKKVEAVTADDVMRVAKQHLDPAKLSIVLVGDRAVVEKQLAQTPLGTFEVVDTTGQAVTPKPAPSAAPPKPATGGAPTTR